MSTLFITYLWHYLAARTIYDSLLRPLVHGHPAPLVMVGVLSGMAFLLGRRSGARGRR